jgi:hypothetical protein
MEEDRQQRERLPQLQGPRADTDQRHLSRAPRYRRDQLAKVKTDGGRGVQIQIDMMNRMEPPEGRRAMHQHVP